MTIKKFLWVAYYIIIGTSLIFGYTHFYKDSYRANAYTAKPSPSEPTIEGTEEFQADVQKSLAFLKDKAPGHYNSVCLYIRTVKLTDYEPGPKIEGWTNSTGTVYIVKSQLEIHSKNREKLRIDTYPLPLTLVHETAHLIQLEQKKPSTGEAAEREALATERDLLHALNMPPEIIELLTGEKRLEYRWWENAKFPKK